MYIRDRIEIYIPENAGEPEKVLILAPAARCEAKDLCGQLVLTLRINELRELKLGWSEAVLGIADILSVQPKGKATLRSLELEKAVFRVSIASTLPDISATGADSISLEFSSTGKDPVDVARCASGGEKSRIMLSLKAMMARYTDMPTMIFDEIDTGVSGSAADRMGSLICEMGRDMQVFAITHLPQVAAKGEAHYLVEREDATTSVRRLEGEDRVREIARMLSGATITPAALANARELLG